MIRFLVYPLSFIFSLPVLAQVKKQKDIPYHESSASRAHTLDVYYPKDTLEKKGVLIFFHGGSWKNGKKNSYGFLGRNMARKGFVTVIANYRLSPEVKIDGMAHDCHEVVKWVHKHIARFGGNPDDITVSGHSAGGHLAALIALDPQHNKMAANPVRRAVLIDAFGLDMVTYFKEYNNDYAKSLREVFSSSPEKWKEYSPIYLINESTRTPFLLLTGAKTFPTITESNAAFSSQLKANNVPTESHTIRRKKHIGMILQFLCRHNRSYTLLIDFMTQGNN